MEKIRILVLAADPKNEMRLRLGEECRKIENCIQLSNIRDKFEIKSAWAVTTDSFLQEILSFKPKIIHFSGHGSNDGICLEDEAGKSKMVSGEALSSLFEQLSDEVECIVLNSCFSENQAISIVQHINYVIGMNEEIGDKDAISFSTGFYTFLGNNEQLDFERAFKIGVSKIKLDGEGDANIPQLCKKKK